MENKLDEKVAIKITIIVIILSLLVGLACGVVFRMNEMRIQVSSEAPAELESGFESCIDSITQDGDYLMLRGWTIKPGEQILQAETHVVLKGVDSGQYYIIPSIVENRVDASVAINPDTDNSQCGFQAKTTLSSIGDESNYIVYIWYHSNNESYLVAPDEANETYIFN